MNEIDLINDPTGRFEWDAPTTREDGEVLSSADIKEYRVYWGTLPGDYQNDIIVPASRTYADFDFTSTPLPIYAVMTVVDTDDRESRYSPETVFVKKTANPNPPTNLRWVGSKDLSGG